ncbi:2'-5' RNA ligase family protein [Stakelama saccharophila]|uniref:2'-5' RNA ligase family protein n=1 Tax=Stakelama saccharophila TaxID=3075605 RepID=A0ABZ0B7J8_9SPHN|nr:2'-5' RNA ligase family protein [Stakelama sp. W311]WNO52601.1 2'-5' RNA ligase family protein [Stakelama sp. W311]
MNVAPAPAPIIVTALFGGEDQAFFDQMRAKHFPPERDQLAAHLTLFHHLPPSLSPELDRRLAQVTRGVPAPGARLAGLIDLGRGVAFRIESPGLDDVRAALADAFLPLLTPQDSVGWRPHVTIQNKVAPREARSLKAELERGFRPRDVRLAGLASWSYRGGPWEAIKAYKFA